jgi:uncharacterized protein YbcI
MTEELQGHESQGHESVRTESSSEAKPSGQALAEISNAIVQLYRDHFGKGPTRAKTYALDDVVICVLRDGLTTVERTLFERGRADSVREMRSAFQDAVAERFTTAVEHHTRRKVIAFMSQAHIDPDLTIEVFFLDGPLPVNGSMEMDGDGNEVPNETAK